MLLASRHRFKNFYNHFKIRSNFLIFKNKNSLKQKKEFLGGRFAAKEAFFKAMGSGFRGGLWRDVEVGHTEEGAPYLILHGYYAEKAAEKSANIPVLSISHDGDYAIAQVIWDA